MAAGDLGAATDRTLGHARAEEVPGAVRGKTGAEGYGPEQSNVIEITTVVFDDGSCEGSPYLAAVTRAKETEKCERWLAAL